MLALLILCKRKADNTKNFHRKMCLTMVGFLNGPYNMLSYHLVFHGGHIQGGEGGDLIVCESDRLIVEAKG